MESRRQNVQEDRLTISQPNKRSKTSTNASERAEPLPVEILSDILSRLPAKSVARCRCVSKPWDSMLRRPDFTELFLTRSRARPQLLICQTNGSELLFYSSPQPQSLDESSSPPIAVNYQMKFDFDGYCESSGHVNGLFCVTVHQMLKERMTPALVKVICNPCTGESVTLPKMITKKRVGIKSYIGYDPIEKQYKVLSMTLSNKVSQEHQVFTLGTGEQSWRMIEGGLYHRPVGNKVICINGVLYYPADSDSSHSVIVCFDVRTEKFSFVDVPIAFFMVTHPATTLINYNGKLASLDVNGYYYVNERSTSFQMCVLEDPEKHEWSKHTYELPPLWPEIVGEAFLCFVGVLGTNDIVLSPRVESDPFYVFFYSLERKTIRRVEIQGMKTFWNDDNRIQIFLNHVENVKLMQAV